MSTAVLAEYPLQPGSANVARAAAVRAAESMSSFQRGDAGWLGVVVVDPNSPANRRRATLRVSARCVVGEPAEALVRGAAYTAVTARLRGDSPHAVAALDGALIAVSLITLRPDGYDAALLMSDYTSLRIHRTEGEVVQYSGYGVPSCAAPPQTTDPLIESTSPESWLNSYLASLTAEDDILPAVQHGWTPSL